MAKSDWLAQSVLYLLEKLRLSMTLPPQGCLKTQMQSLNLMDANRISQVGTKLLDTFAFSRPARLRGALT